MNLYDQFKRICEENDHYPTRTELIYKYGLTQDNLKEISGKKVTDDAYVKLPLSSPNGGHVHYWHHEPFIMHFSGSQDLIRNSDMNRLPAFGDTDMLNGFIFSEIESSLAIEGVRSTRAQIEKLQKAEYHDLDDLNDIIVKNMLMGHDFIRNHDMTEDTIHQLYLIVSNRSLKEDEQLKPDAYYRHDEVDIVDGANAIVDRGASWRLLPSLMGELIRFIDQEKTYEEHLIASHIIHYHLVRIHPYFDYNGRMARMLSLWYNLKHAPSLGLLLVSEAINNTFHKPAYYNAIMNSRQSGDDITYFLEYMGRIILSYTKTYVNFHTMKARLKGKGILLSRSLEIALKQVLAMPVTGDGYFDWKDYKDFSHDDFTKQYYLKLLNALAGYGILSVKEHKKAKLYKLNREQWDLLG
jgi:Fic family protein